MGRYTKGVRIMETGKKKKVRDRGSKKGCKKREINFQRMIGGRRSCKKDSMRERK
jgi:hypothetical protein